MKYFFDKIYRYCIDYLKVNAIGVSATVFAIVVFLTLFLFLKPYFFPNFMETKFETDEERSDYAIEQLTR